MNRELKFLLRFAADTRALERARQGFAKFAAAEREVARQAKAVATSTAAASVATANFGKAAQAAGARASAAFARTTAVLRTLLTSLGALGLGFGLAGVVSTVAQFGAAMSRVQAITGELARDLQGNLNPTFLAIQDTVRDLGATTVFTASQAAEAFALLSQAGFEAGESIAATADVLNLAIVGAIDLNTSANIVANAVRGFGLAASEANRVADVFAATITRSNTNVNELGEAMKFVAPIASSLGISIEETAAAIGVLSDAGLKGTLAGTGLRRVLIGLANQTPKAAKTLKDAGVDVDNLRESMGEEGLVGALREFEGRTLSAAEAVDVFGLRGGPAFLILQRGAEQTGSLTAALEEAEGRAREFAEVARDNLAGDLKLLRSVIEDVILGTGQLNDQLRNIVQTASGVIQVFAGTLDPLDQNAQKYRELANNISLAFQAFKLLLGVLIALKVFGVIVSLVTGAVTAFTALSAAVTTVTAAIVGATAATGAFAAALAATGIGALIVAAGLLVAALVKIATEVDRLDQRLDEVSGTMENLREVTGRVAEATGDLAIQQLPNLERAAERAQKQFAALTMDIAALREEADAIRQGNLLDVFRSEQLTLGQKLVATFRGFAVGSDAAGEAARILGQKAKRAEQEGLSPLADALAEAQAQLQRVQDLQAASDELSRLGRAGEALVERLSEATKTVEGFSGTAKKALEDLNIEIGDLSLGVGEAADLQRKINEELRDADLEIVIPAELTTARAEAAEILIDLQQRLREAEELTANQAIENGDAIVANLQVQVEQAKRAVQGADEAIAARQRERNQLIQNVTTVFQLTEANKAEEEARKAAAKAAEQQAEAQKKLAESTADLIMDTQLEIQLLGASERERKSLVFAMELEKKAREAGLDSITAQQQSLIALREELERQRRENIGAALATQLKNFVDEGTDLAKQFGDAFGNVLTKVEDQIVDFVKTGEFNFREFAQSILDEFIKLGVRLALSGALQKIQGALSPQGGAGGVLGGLLGGGAGGPGAQARAAAGLPTQARESGVLDAIKRGTVVAQDCCAQQVGASEALGDTVLGGLDDQGGQSRSQEQGLFGGLFSRLDSFASAAGKFLGGLGGNLKALGSTLLDGLKGALKGLGNFIVNGIQALGQFIQGIGQVIGNVLSSILGPLVSAVGQLAGVAVQALGQIITTLIQGISDLIAGTLMTAAATLMITAATELIAAATLMLAAAPILIAAATLQLTAGALLSLAAGLLLAAAGLQIAAAVLQIAAASIQVVASVLLVAAGALLIVAATLLIVAAILQAVTALIPGFAKGGISDSPDAFVPARGFKNPMFFADGGTTTGRDRIPAMLSPNEGVVPLNNNRAIPVEMEDGGGGDVFNTTFNITTPDVAGFNKSKGQIQAEMDRMMKRSSERNN